MHRARSRRRGALLRSCLALAAQALVRHKQSTGLFVSGLAPPPFAFGYGLLLYFATQRPLPSCSITTGGASASSPLLVDGRGSWVWGAAK